MPRWRCSAPDARDPSRGARGRAPDDSGASRPSTGLAGRPPRPRGAAADRPAPRDARRGASSARLRGPGARRAVRARARRPPARMAGALRGRSAPGPAGDRVDRLARARLRGAAHRARAGLDRGPVGRRGASGVGASRGHGGRGRGTRRPRDPRPARGARRAPRRGAPRARRGRMEWERSGAARTSRAGGRGKRWPATGFAAVLEQVATLPRLAIVLHQGPADFDAVAALPEPLTARAITLREPPLPLLAGILTHATAYLGNDSGISHLAAAVGVPSIVLYGAERLMWRPWAEHVEPVVISPGAERSDAMRVTAELTAFLR